MRTTLGYRRMDPDETEGRRIYRAMAERDALMSLASRRCRYAPAQGTEAGTGETREAGLDPKDDGPVGNADAPNLSPMTSNHIRRVR